LQQAGKLTKLLIFFKKLKIKLRKKKKTFCFFVLYFVFQFIESNSPNIQNN